LKRLGLHSLCFMRLSKVEAPLRRYTERSDITQSKFLSVSVSVSVSVEVPLGTTFWREKSCVGYSSS